MFALELFNRHKGTWIINQEIENTPAQEFWIKTINDYTKGKFYRSMNKQEEYHPYQKFTN